MRRVNFALIKWQATGVLIMRGPDCGDRNKSLHLIGVADFYGRNGTLANSNWMQCSAPMGE